CGNIVLRCSPLKRALYIFKFYSETIYMGTHSTTSSLALIDFIKNLGISLGYYVVDEHPMTTNKFGSQAIDIAWFNEESSTFPLFIFEVESTTNNAMANNPTKVFGKDSSVFEKPLFFFHIIVDSAKNSEKYDDLMGMFGRYNYAIFKVNNGELIDFIIKIISQHRRVRERFDLESVIKLLLSSAEIKENIDFDYMLPEVENILHDNQKPELGQIYSNIACGNIGFQEDYLKFVNRAFMQNNLNDLNYDGYRTRMLSGLINLGILYHKFNGEHAEQCYVSLLDKYQNQFDTFKTIDYLPGLNQDYEMFIEDQLPYYLALAFMLFHGNQNAQKFILNLEVEIIRKIPMDNDCSYSHHVSWALLMSATNSQFYHYFEEIRRISNKFGKVLDSIVYDPIFENKHIKRAESKFITIPEIDEYKKTISKNIQGNHNTEILSNIAIKSLSPDWRFDEIDYDENLGVTLSFLMIQSW
ncbi:hypothetical protein CGI05_23860, partial [Vibrio parahaemolyticus]|uniref:hypothetical protein n=3 Tax=Vibrio parahaemolyticus TaxID=670 RepID=UPI001171A115